MANQDKLSTSDFQLIQKHMEDTIVGDMKLAAAAIYQKLGKKLSVSMTEAEFRPALSIAIRNNDIVGFEGRTGRNGGYVRVGTPTKKALAAAAAKQEAPKPEPKPEPEESSGDTSSEDPVDPVADTDPAPVTKLSDIATINKAAAERAAELAAKQGAAKRPFGVPRTDIPNQEWKRVQRLKVLVQDRHYEVPMAACDVRKLVIDVLQGEKQENGPIEVEGVRYTCNDLQLLERFLFNFFEAIKSLFSTDHPDYIAPYPNDAGATVNTAAENIQ